MSMQVPPPAAALYWLGRSVFSALRGGIGLSRDGTWGTLSPRDPPGILRIDAEAGGDKITGSRQCSAA